MKKLSLLVAVAALAAPGTAAAARERGVVVKVDRQAHLVAVAERGGSVVRVHTPRALSKPFRIGQRLSFAARQLRNGTVAGSAFRVAGRASRLTIHGTVRAFNSRKQTITLSAGGATLRMKLAARRTFMASSPPPKVGSDVTVTASVQDDDTLEADDVQEVDNNDQAENDDDQQAENDDQSGDDQSGDDGASSAPAGGSGDSGSGSGGDD
ncbi:MAG: hypothetical protein E6G42_06540 [Actinobacteria bacterium]|nr:MAG: hypothetical protein E6G42_06540 [Actinomycetota bacterium]